MLTIDNAEAKQMKQLYTWWQKYGRYGISFLVLFSLSLLGIQAWRSYQANLSVKASDVYQQLQIYEEQGKRIEITAAAEHIFSNYPRTVYADYARLILARQAILMTPPDEKKAITLLSQVVDHGHSFAIQQTARLRLARLLLSQKQYDRALKTLTQMSNYAEPWVEMCRGDAYLGLRDLKKAREAYEKAGILLHEIGQSKANFLQKELALKLANAEILIQE